MAALERMDTSPSPSFTPNFTRTSSLLTPRTARKPLLRRPAPTSSTKNKNALREEFNARNKAAITVSQTCRFLQLLDYPVPVAAAALPFLSDWSNFRGLVVPLLASVNLGAPALRLETLARWGHSTILY